MLNLGEQITTAECQCLIEVNTRNEIFFTILCFIVSQEADIDGDGQINYEEFYFYMNSGDDLRGGKWLWKYYYLGGQSKKEMSQIVEKVHKEGGGSKPKSK